MLGTPRLGSGHTKGYWKPSCVNEAVDLGVLKWSVADEGGVGRGDARGWQPESGREEMDVGIVEEEAEDMTGCII